MSKYVAAHNKVAPNIAPIAILAFAPVERLGSAVEGVGGGPVSSGMVGVEAGVGDRRGLRYRRRREIRTND